MRLREFFTNFVPNFFAMEKKLTFNGLNFVPYLTEARILEQVERVAREIQRDYAGQRLSLIHI